MLSAPFLLFISLNLPAIKSSASSQEASLSSPPFLSRMSGFFNRSGESTKSNPKRPLMQRLPPLGWT